MGYMLVILLCLGIFNHSFIQIPKFNAASFNRFSKKVYTQHPESISGEQIIMQTFHQHQILIVDDESHLSVMLGTDYLQHYELQ